VKNLERLTVDMVLVCINKIMDKGHCLVA
jgi:hypothetical protein